MRIVLIILGLLTIVLASGLIWHNQTYFLAAGYGSTIALFNAYLLHYRIQQATYLAPIKAERGMLLLYLGAVQRFIFVLIGFALGIKLFGLSPLLIMTGFAWAQLGVVVYAATIPLQPSNKSV